MGRKNGSGYNMHRSNSRSIDNPKAFVKMSAGHEVEGMRRINGTLEQPHKFQIESDKFLIILSFLLQTDG